MWGEVIWFLGRRVITVVTWRPAAGYWNMFVVFSVVILHHTVNVTLPAAPAVVRGNIIHVIGDDGRG